MPATTRLLSSLAALVVLAACGDGPFVPPFGQDQPRLAYTFRIPGQNGRIATMNADGTDARFVTDGTRDAAMPAWAPDGARLAMSYVGTVGEAARIWTIRPDGSDLTEIPMGFLAGRHPSWSATGGTIAFDDGFGLRLMTTTGANLRPFLAPDALNGVPRWSPDGSRLLFTGFQPGFGTPTTRRLYITRPDGTDLAQLASGLSSAITYADWAPDGLRIVFGTEDNNLWIVSIVTGEVTPLLIGPELDQMPTWSPRGDRIAFVRYTGAIRNIFDVRVDGSDVRQLTRGDADLTHPTYEPVTAWP